MSEFQSFHKKEYTLPSDENTLYNIKTAAVTLLGFVGYFDPHPSDHPEISALSAEEKAVEAEAVKQRALTYIENLKTEEATCEELNLLAEAVFALVKSKQLPEACYITQVLISQVREKLSA
jgi:hypothetical protein